MKKIFCLSLLITVILSLAACNNEDENNDEVYIEKEPVLVDDKELMTYDELPIFYDNKMTVVGKDAPDPFADEWIIEDADDPFEDVWIIEDADDPFE